MSEKVFLPIIEVPNRGRAIVRGMGYLDSEAKQNPSIPGRVTRQAELMAAIMEGNFTGDWLEADVGPNGTLKVECSLSEFTHSMFAEPLEVAFISGPVFDSANEDEEFDDEDED